ncbi:MAG: MmgE/PrpD family protein [Nocardioidaceae bacterium]
MSATEVMPSWLSPTDVVADISAGERLVDFAVTLTWEQVPRGVRNHVAVLAADLVASSVAGRLTPTSRIAAEVAADLYGGQESLAWFDGRRLSVSGAAFANAVMANALDFDDGHRLTKGHPGAIVIPTAVAVAQRTGASLTELMTAVVLGYEVGIRAGIVQHDRRAEYHSTGSWGSVGAAVAAGRLLGLDRAQMRHAIGLAEYHGPISLIMRSVDDPQMTKDGIGWGAQVAVSSAVLAQSGFTAVQPDFLAAADFGSVGAEWVVQDVYVKPFPCCRWGQSAIAAALEVRQQVPNPADIARVEIRTFAAAAALSDRRPVTTEEAQYNLVWPVAAALRHGHYEVADVVSGFDDPAVHALADRITVTVDPELTAGFPDVRRAGVSVVLGDGSRIDSGLLEAHGEPGGAQWREVVATKVEQQLGRQLAPGDVDPPEVSLGDLGVDELLAALAYATRPDTTRPDELSNAQ